jgi:hypothetical protein
MARTGWHLSAGARGEGSLFPYWGNAEHCRNRNIGIRSETFRGHFSVAKNQKPALSVVEPTDATAPAPPRRLGKHGLSLWHRVLGEYEVSDAGGLELLCLAAEAIDRAEGLRAEIERDGAFIRARGSVRDHPGLKHELSNRAFAARTLARLGLDVEPLRASGGRPPQRGCQGP